MKKIIITILMLSGMFSTVSAEIGVNIGVSGQIGTMESSGKEVSSATSTTRNSDKEKTIFATGGIFVEKDLAFLPFFLGKIGKRIHIGYDNISHDLNFGTIKNTRSSTLGDAAGAGTIAGAHNHTLKAKMTAFETTYATFNITDWLYVKTGNVSVDIETKFTGTATSSYGTKHGLDGTVFGVGIQKMSENGLFFRVEYNDYDIDGKSVVNAGADSVFTATLNDVSGDTTRLSIGKAF